MARFYVFLLVFAFSASCGEKPRATKADEKNYYLEFVDLENSYNSKLVIRFAKNRLLGRGFYYGAKQDDRWIHEAFADTVNSTWLDKDFQQVHNFNDISKYDSTDVNAEKIVITYHKPLKGNVANFNFLAYRKLGHKEWQPVFNPGNFRNGGPFEAREKDLGVWLGDLIVKLTFK